MVILSEGQLKFVRSSWQWEFMKKKTNFADAHFDEECFFCFAMTTIVTVKNSDRNRHATWRLF